MLPEKSRASAKCAKRATRRGKTKAVQVRRVKLARDSRGWKMDERHKGMAKRSNFSCGCRMCKPWKQKKDRKKVDLSDQEFN